MEKLSQFDPLHLSMWYREQHSKSKIIKKSSQFLFVRSSSENPKIITNAEMILTNPISLL